MSCHDSGFQCCPRVKDALEHTGFQEPSNHSQENPPVPPLALPPMWELHSLPHRRESRLNVRPGHLLGGTQGVAKAPHDSCCSETPETASFAFIDKVSKKTWSSSVQALPCLKYLLPKVIKPKTGKKKQKQNQKNLKSCWGPGFHDSSQACSYELVPVPHNKNLSFPLLTNRTTSNCLRIFSL